MVDDSDRVTMSECNSGNPVYDFEKLIPQPGMIFSSKEDVRNFYNSYAEREGFGVAKKHGKCDDEGMQRYFNLACSCSGKHVPSGSSTFNKRPSMKTDCKAKINVIVRVDGSCMISKVALDHNHVLSPTKSRRFRSHRRLDSVAKRVLDINDQAGIKLGYNSSAIKAGGFDSVLFEEKDCRNYMTQSRLSKLGGGDAEALNAYFIRMHKRNSNFYHVVNYDDDCRIQNIFWADARSRAAFESFSDVISFDTTYLTNKYDMSFVTFVGVNHHGQSILFGCGLLSNEDIQTYIWLFNAWLECMSGRKPKAIVTDECKAIQVAVAEVFPESYYRICLWHVMKKIPEKLGSFKRYKEIKKCLKSIVYECLTINEFEEKWSGMIEEFGVGHDVWLCSLYNDRKRWVPVFVKDTFWAGMSTTQRNESMNAFFDGYVNSKTTLKQFVEQYDNALKRNVENEDKADFASFNSRIPLITDFYFEKQFQDSYTNVIFRKFQDEIKGMIFCNVVPVVQDSSIQAFDVIDISKGKDGSSKKIVYSVFYDEDKTELRCLCRLFEFSGIMCRHSIKVLLEMNIFEVPSIYILDRWRKDVKRKHNFVNNCYDDISSGEKQSWHDELYSLFCLVDAVGTTTYEKFQHAKKTLDVLHQQLLDNNARFDSVRHTTDIECHSEIVVRSPVKVRSKGHPPLRRKAPKIFKPKIKRGKTIESSEEVVIVEDVAVTASVTC